MSPKRGGYYLQKTEDGGAFVYPRDANEVAEHYGGPINWFEIEEQAKACVARLNAEKRAAPIPSPDKGG